VDAVERVAVPALLSPCPPPQAAMSNRAGSSATRMRFVLANRKLGYLAVEIDVEGAPGLPDPGLSISGNVQSKMRS
jgi:hypothetical protein